MSLTLDSIITGLLDRLNASTDEFWLNSNFLLYARDFLRRTDVRLACWHQKRDTTLTTVLGQNEYPLPADFWRVEEVWWTPIAGQRDQRIEDGQIGDNFSRPRWLLRGGKLWLEPAPELMQAGFPLKVYYVRTPTPPTSTAALLDMPDDLGEALQAYLMGRAMEKGGPEMGRAAGQALAEAEARIGQAAAGRAQRPLGFNVTARW